MKTITREELQSRIQSIVLLEALPEAHYQKGHLPGAKAFPLDRARDLARAVAPHTRSPIVVYCASETCASSHQAAKLLSDIGYTDVSVYAGGKADWQAAGLPLEV